MFGLETRHIEFILSTLRQYIPEKDVKFYIFGSRAKGTFKEYSDIAVDLNGKSIPASVLAKILCSNEMSDDPEVFHCVQFVWLP